MQVIPWDHKRIEKPGWYSGIPLELYHSADICAGLAVSSSDLRACWSKSPAHMYLNWAENPKREVRETTSAMLLGACAHHLLLGEENFKLKYIAQPETYRDRTTAAAKPWNNNSGFCRSWNDKQRREGRVVVKAAQLDVIVAMARSLALEPLVNEGLLKGHVECSGFAKDRETGLWLKVRPDVIPTMAGDFVDLKTASEVITPALQYAIRSYGYHQQGALIWEVVEQLGAEHPFAGFALMFVESVRPHCARTVPLTDDDLARGRKQNRAMLRKIAGCIDTGHWPGPGEGDLTPLPLSHDERTRIDERLRWEGLS
jgi:hypothetical protein